MPSGKEGKDMDAKRKTKPRITENNHYDEAGRPKLIEYDPYRNDALLYKDTSHGETRLMYLGKEVTDAERSTLYNDGFAIFAMLRLEGGDSKCVMVSKEEFGWINSAIRPPVGRFVHR